MAKELIYTIRIDTATAKSQASGVRAAFEKELRQIKVGALDTSSLKTATGQAKALGAELERAARAGDLGQLDSSGIGRASSEAQRLRNELEMAGSAADDIRVPTISSGGAGGLGGLQGLAGGLLGGFASGAIIGQLKEVGQALDELARRGAVFSQIGDVLDDYAKSVGTSSDAMINAAKKAAQGTIAEFELILNANRAIQFEVAKTPEAFAKLIELSTALGRAQGISDTQALEFLTTGLARESRLILDNLGLIIDLDEATAQYAATLGKTADELTTAERKQALLDEAFRQGAVAIQANRDAVDSAATQFERLDANTQNLRDSFGQWLAEASADKIGAIADALALVNRELFKSGTSSGIQEQIDAIQAQRAELLSTGKVEAPMFGMFGFSGDTEAKTRLVAAYDQQLKELEAQLQKVAVAESIAGTTMQQAATLSMQAADAHTQAYNQVILAQERATALAKESISAQSEALDKALLSRAEEAVPEVGVERALEQYRQAKEAADAAINELAASGVTDAAEIQLRIAQITDSLTAGFDQIAQIDFGQMAAALGNFDVGFVDFLPGIDAAREELAQLSEELLYSGALTEEQAARFDYLSAVAYSVADGGSALNQVVGELGSKFLESNAYAAALVEQLFLAEAAFRNGQISAGIYAGITTTLTGRLLGLAQGAGIATSAIYALNQAQADMSNLSGFAGGQAIGGNIANRIQTQQGTQAREHNRREQERYAREQERAAKSAARHTETSARKAGKELEDGAKKAAQELKSALDKVPGLFSTTSVTDQDMKDTELGIYQEKADEYLRRLRDEVENGVDWADVSIEEARAGLERAGLAVGGTADATVAMLERAINDQSLFAAAENIPIFINEAAVEAALELQKKSEEGRNNIYEYFGVVMDEAVDAATGGGAVGGGGGSSYTPPEITPPDYIDVDPFTEGIQTGFENYVKQAGKTAQEAIEKKAAEFTGDSWFGGGKKTGATGGTAAVPTITITADEKAQALAPLAARAMEQGSATVPLPKNAASQMALDLGDQLGQQSAIFKAQGETIGGLLISGISAAMSVNAEGDAQIDIAGFIAGSLSAQVETLMAQGAGIASIIGQGIATGASESETSLVGGLITNLNTQLRAESESLKREGATVAQIIMAGILAQFQASQGMGGQGGAGGQADTGIAGALLTNISSQFSASANMFYAVGFLPASSVQSGFKNYEYTGLADSFMEKLTSNIRENADALGQRGGTMASYVQSGFVSAFNSEAFKTQLTAIGDMMYTYIEIGILARVNGGALTNAIAAKVVEDLAVEMEQP
jgi:hypothetical protein